MATYERGRGKYGRLRNAVIAQPLSNGPATGPGGPPPTVLTRPQTAEGAAPEFLSATFLPGRGFNLWQITAFLPGHGEVPLLFAPSVEHATELLSGSGSDSNGSAAATAGAAFLAPWAGRLSGSAPPAGTGLQTMWSNTPLLFPAQTPGSSVSTEGLLLKQVADSVNTSSLADGETAQAVFHAQSFGNQWPSSTDITVEADLAGSTLELTLTAHNVGSAPEPMGLGWLPHFAIPSGRRAGALLTIPASSRVPGGERGGLPTGHPLSVTDTPYDLQRAGGTLLGSRDLDETYLDLHSALLADGPIAELRDPSFGYGLRIIPLSSNITNLRVIAPADKPWVSIGPNTNVPNPFGPSWQGLDSNGVLTLQPGATVQWKIRLELFSLSTETQTP